MTRARSLTGPPAAPDTDPGTDWRERAACIGAEDLYDRAADHPSDAATIRDALAICHACPVQRECLAANLDVEHGIIGGTTPAERDALSCGEPPPPPAPRHDEPCPDCGLVFTTRSGLGKHYRAMHPGRCLYGHELPQGGKCRACRNRNNRRQMRARRAKGAAA